METDEIKVLGPIDIADKIISGEFSIKEGKPGRSKVWMLFTKILNRDGIEIPDYVYCKGCEKVFTFKHSTSNLVKHRCYTKSLSGDNDVSIVEDEKPIIEVDENPVDKITKLLTRWIIKDCQPYNLVQNEGLLAIFQEIARVGSKFGSDLDIGKLLPTMIMIDKNVSAMYEQCFKKIKTEIASIQVNGFGLTTDIWSDSLSKQSYIAVTIHYLKNGELKFRLLGLQALEGEKSANRNVAEKVKQILKDFDCELSSKSMIVTDKYIFKTIPDTKFLPCISQLLDYALLKSVEEVEEVAEIINSCFKLMGYLKKMGLHTLLGGILHNFGPSRWILMHKMLSSVESNWNEIVNTLESRNESELILKINIHHLRATIKTFQPFEEAIETLEDDSCATLHLVLVYLHELKKSCDTNDNEFKDFDFIQSLKENLRHKIDELVAKNITIIHKLALFLYPPTNKLLQFSDDDKKSVNEECIRRMKCYENESKPTIKQEPEPLNTPVCKRRKLFSDFVETDVNYDPNELIVQEIQCYKNARIVNSIDFDLFGWWELQKDNFPLLYKLSCTILATPATSASSKRIFPLASSLLCEKSYQCSNEADAEKIMFINSNCEHDEFDNYFSAGNNI